MDILMKLGKISLFALVVTILLDYVLPYIYKLLDRGGDKNE